MSTTTYETREDAIAAAFADAKDGEEVAIHHPWCATRDAKRCSCVPVVHVVRRGRS